MGPHTGCRFGEKGWARGDEGDTPWDQPLHEIQEHLHVYTVLHCRGQLCKVLVSMVRMKSIKVHVLYATAASILHRAILGLYDNNFISSHCGNFRKKKLIVE